MIIVRLDSSSYFSPGFSALERLELCSIRPEISYCPSFEVFEGSYLAQPPQEWMAITNSQSDLARIPASWLSKLRLVIHPNSGYDNFTPAFVDACPVPIIIGHEIRAQAVAEATLSCLFERFCLVQNQTSWSRDRQFPRKLLAHQHVQLIGYGHLGKILETSLRPLVARISVFDPFKDLLSLNLLEANIVIVAASLNPTSQNLINAAFLEQLPTGFSLFNPARGALVNLEDLLYALDRDKEAYAYLDVFEKEPFPLEKLASYHSRGQLKTSSHIAGVFSGLENVLVSFEKRVLHHFFNLTLMEFSSLYEQSNLKLRRRSDFLI
jgi:D-3-phosphoglycerate dehydrogenase / 2-oxoglutarate reductase